MTHQYVNFRPVGQATNDDSWPILGSVAFTVIFNLAAWGSLTLSVLWAAG